MTRLIISGFAAIAVLAAATTMLWWHSPSSARSVGAAGMTSMQELHTTAGASKLPIEEFEDMSLVYSTAPKR